MGLTFWVIFLFAIFIVEFLVPGPTALWFGAGAIVGGIISLAGDNIILEWICFWIATVIVAMLLRPVMKKWKETPPERTNVDALIGKMVHVIETINNYEETGVAMLEGKEWMARSVDEELVIPEGAMGIVREISGVKLMLEPVEKANKK